MVIHKEGDTTKGPCYTCGKLVVATFRYAPLKYDGIDIPDILQGFCDVCGAPISISHQSTYRIREFRENYSHALELRVPPHYIDILVAIGMTQKISQKPNLLCRLLSELYLAKIIGPQGARLRKRVLAALEDELAAGRNRDRLSCQFPDTTFTALKTVSSEERRNSSEIVKGIIVAAKHDILDNEHPAIGRELEQLAAARL